MDLTDEEKAKYEKELIDFITQRIKNVGGSLQFQYLNNLSSQLSFETKNAVASNKVQLMKFLRSHTKLFNVDARGLVSIVENPSLDLDHQITQEKFPDEKENLPQCINNGTGKISKIHSEFGYITVTEPFATKVHFKASSFGREFYILHELDLEIGKTVSFNAVKGPNDYEVPYRATKVWLKDYPCIKNKTEPEPKNEIDGEGSIQKLFPDHGLISVTGQKKTTIFFSKFILPNHKSIGELGDEFKVGDRVMFTAVESSKAKWRAISVTKLDQCDSRDTNQLNSMDKKPESGKKDMIRNGHGIISPLKTGANILFGEDFKSIASAGDSCVFFLYGSQVYEIAWEFSDGDDVLFDAVKIKADPGWKAVMVWVGEKPNFVSKTDLGDFREFTDEEQDETALEDTDSYNSNQVAPKQSNRVYRDQGSNLQQKLYEPSSRKIYEPKSKHKNKNATEGKYSKQRFKSEVNDFHSSSYQNFKKAGKQNRSPQSRINDRKKKNISNVRNYQIPSISNDNECFSDESDKNIFQDKNVRKSPRNGSKKHFPSSSKSIQHVDGGATGIHRKRNFLVPFEDEEKAYKSGDDEESCENHEKIQGIASIKVHRGIHCEIFKVFCKVAYAKNPCLQNEVVFMPNAFYFDGCSADEQQIDDFKEVLEPGKIVRLNCFEIVDDFGKHHNKVTMAWIGEEPQIAEMSPQDFICEHDLSVTIDDVTHVEDSILSIGDSKKNLAADFSDDGENIEATASFSNSSSSEDSSDEESSLGSKTYAQTPIQNSDYFQVLSEKIILKLGDQGLLSNSKIDLDNLSTEIVDMILKTMRGEELSDCTRCCKLLNQKPTNLNLQTKEVQTIVTGNIVAESIFTAA